MREPRSLWPALVILAVVVGTFHGLLKPGLDEREIGDLTASMRQAAWWLGRYPADFAVELLDGETLQLADRVGEQIVVLNFFTTWCMPCRREMPELERFAREAGEEVLLLGIDVGEDRETVERFLAEVEVSFPVALDQSRTIASNYGVESFPTTVLIGIDGRIALYQSGAISNAEVTLGGPLTAQRTARRQGAAISKEDYLAALEEQPDRPGGRGQSDQLEGRALRIAEEMPCPCGCEQQVLHCVCQTASKIKQRLADVEGDERDDAEIMQALDKEFCVGGAS